tara:strand:+ start:1921 stop:2412 length:492 start_codon:yes stop_codon:yes gene_type:complete
MIAFLMFFYFFIFVFLFVAIVNRKEVTVIYITTKDLTHYPNYDSDDNDEMLIDEGDSNVKHSNDNEDYIQTYQIQMKTKTKDEKILYEFHSYLSEHNINEVSIVMTVKDDDIEWDIKYNFNVYEKFYDLLINYINDNFLSENLVVFLNGANVETYSINPELVK